MWYQRRGHAPSYDSCRHDEPDLHRDEGGPGAALCRVPTRGDVRESKQQNKAEIIRTLDNGRKT